MRGGKGAGQRHSAGGGQFLLIGVVDAIPQFLAGFEMGDVLAGQGHGVAGLGIATDPGRAIVKGEAAEAADLDPFTAGQGVAHALDDVAHGKFHILVGQLVVRLGGQDFDQVGFGHDADLPPIESLRGRIASGLDRACEPVPAAAGRRRGGQGQTVTGDQPRPASSICCLRMSPRVPVLA